MNDRGRFEYEYCFAEYEYRVAEYDTNRKPQPLTIVFSYSYSYSKTANLDRSRSIVHRCDGDYGRFEYEYCVAVPRRRTGHPSRILPIDYHFWD